MSTLAANVSGAATNRDPITLSRAFDKLYRSQSSAGTLRMTVHTPHYERTLKMTVWSRGMDRTLVRILSPKKEKGVASLKRDNEMWNYLPKVRRTIRVPPSMMMGSWMGSNFTNDDLMRESSWEDDYLAKAAAMSTPDRPCLEYRPRPHATVTWQRVTLCFDGAAELPTEQVWYDEKGRRARTMTFSGVRAFGARRIPAKLRLVSDLKPDNWTEIEYLDLRFDVPTPDTAFSLAAMRRGR